MPVVTTNMKLTKWTTLSDRFDHEKLAANFEAIDVHDHTSLKGKQIPHEGLDVLSVDETNLIDGSVLEQKIADGAVTEDKIANGAVTTVKIATKAITPDKLDDAVTTRIGTIISDGVDQLTARNGTVPAWQTGTLVNGWSGPFSYYRDNTERVWIELGYPGLMAIGPLNVADGCFQLDPGFRPARAVWIPSYPGMLRINPDGWVRPMTDQLGFKDKDNIVGNSEVFMATGSFRAAP